MDIRKAEQAMVNGIYAAVAWLLLDLGFLVQEHGRATVDVILSRPAIAAGGLIAIACIAGLFYKSRLAASVLFLLFLVPLVLRMVQGAQFSAMLLLFSFILLYFFFAAMLGAFRYHHLRTREGGPE